MIIEWIRRREHWVNKAYYLIYAILFFSALMGTTEFMRWEHITEVRNGLYMGATAAMLLLWLLGIAVQQDRRVNAVKIVLLVLGMAQFLFGGGSSLFLILMILIGATDRKSAKVILTESLIIGICIMIITYLASVKGYIAYNITSDGRRSFGFSYYSHFSDKILYFYMMYRCLKARKLGIVEGVVAVVLMYLDFRYTHARTVTICFIAFLILCIAYDVMQIQRIKSIKLPTWIGDLMAFIAAGAYVWATMLSFLGIYIYRWMQGVSELSIPPYLQSFMARLFFNSRALEEYGIRLLGQKVFEVTNPSAGENIISGSFYLDNSFIRLFIITGVLALGVFVVYMSCFVWKSIREQRWYLVFALLVAAIGGLSETFTINFYYNVFAILAFSNLGYIGKSGGSARPGTAEEYGDVG